MIDFLVTLTDFEENNFEGSYPLARRIMLSIIDGEKIIDERERFWIILDYPLIEDESVLMIKEGGNWTKQDFADALSEAYLRHWRECRSNFCNHSAGELFLEGAECDKRGNWSLSIGS